MPTGTIIRTATDIRMRTVIARGKGTTATVTKTSDQAVIAVTTGTVIEENTTTA